MFFSDADLGTINSKGNGNLGEEKHKGRPQENISTLSAPYRNF